MDYAEFVAQLPGILVRGRNEPGEQKTKEKPPEVVIQFRRKPLRRGPLDAAPYSLIDGIERITCEWKPQGAGWHMTIVMGKKHWWRNLAAA